MSYAAGPNNNLQYIKHDLSSMFLLYEIISPKYEQIKYEKGYSSEKNIIMYFVSIRVEKIFYSLENNFCDIS